MARKLKRRLTQNPRAIPTAPRDALRDFVIAALPYIHKQGLPVPNCTEHECKALGCGVFGCVFSTQTPGVVVKVTNLWNEARLWNLVRYSYEIPELSIVRDGFPLVDYMLRLRAKNVMGTFLEAHLIWREEVIPQWEEFVPESDIAKITEATKPFQPIHGDDEYAANLKALSAGPSALDSIAGALFGLFYGFGVGVHDVHEGNLSVPLRNAQTRNPQLVIHDAVSISHNVAAQFPVDRITRIPTLEV